MFTPTIVKLLEYLRDSKEKASPYDLALIINEEQEYVNKALIRLLTVGILSEEEGAYSYHSTDRNEQSLAGLVKVYEVVRKRRESEWFTRALICEIPPRYLFHFNSLLEMAQEKGIAIQVSTEFLQQEIEQGYLTRLRVARLGARPYPLPRYIPPYWFSHLRLFRWEEYQDLKQDSEGFTIQEDDYLTQQYPPQIIKLARQQAGKKREELRDQLRRKGLLDNLARFW